MFRRVRQWFAGPEVEALARDVATYRDKVEELAHKGEGLDLKLERLRNRVQMRLARAGVAVAPEDARDAEIMREIEERSRGRGGEDDFFNEPPPRWN